MRKKSELLGMFLLGVWLGKLLDRVGYVDGWDCEYS